MSALPPPSFVLRAGEGRSSEGPALASVRSRRIPRFSPPRHLSMGENCGNTVLGQCFVFVETRDKANNDSSAGFAKRIEELGGRVANKLTDKVTHVVFKGGKKTTWDAATAKGIPLVSPMWVAAAETEEECADPSDHRAAMPKPSDAPQKSMEPVPVRSPIQHPQRSHCPVELSPSW